jgi:neuromedin U receptor 1
MSKLSRAIKHIIIIWIVSLLLAIPLAIQFEVTTNIHGHEECTVHKEIIQHSFELSTILVFFIPMTLITVLYLLIGLKLRSRTVRRENGGANSRNLSSSFRKQTAQGTKRVLKMLGMEN